MKFLIFQHAQVEHPGIFREFFAADGIEWHAVELDEGEPIPSLDGFDALMAFGGPMDVWQESSHPWLVAETWRTPWVEQSERWTFQKSVSVKSHSTRLVRPPRFSGTCRWSLPVLQWNIGNHSS